MSCSYEKLYVSGESKYIGIDVTSEDSFTVSSEVFSLKRCSDQSLILDEVAAEQSAITDGIQVKYNLDTAGLETGSYLAIFEFLKDSVEKRKKTIQIKISDLSC